MSWALLASGLVLLTTLPASGMDSKASQKTYAKRDRLWTSAISGLHIPQFVKRALLSRTTSIPAEALRGLSLAHSTKVAITRSGLVFRSREELFDALRVYGAGLRIKARGQGMKLLREYYPRIAWVVDTLWRDARKGASDPTAAFVENLIEQIEQSGSYFHKSLDYGALGTPFFREPLTVAESRGTHVLTLGASKNYEPADDLAELLGCDRAITGATITTALDPVDSRGEWVSIDLVTPLGHLLPPRQIGPRINLGYKDARLAWKAPGVSCNEKTAFDVRFGITQAGAETNSFPDAIGGRTYPVGDGRIVLPLDSSGGTSHLVVRVDVNNPTSGISRPEELKAFTSAVNNVANELHAE